MYIASVIDLNRFSTAAFLETPKRGRAEGVPTTPTEQQIDATLKCLFPRIARNVAKRTIHQTAERIIRHTPEVLGSLSNYNTTFLARSLKSFCRPNTYPPEMRQNMRATLFLLYSTSLVNSSYSGMVQSLEKTLPELLSISTRGDTLFQQNVELGLTLSKDSRKKLSKTNELIAQISSYLKLFEYIDPEMKEKIETIYTYAETGGRPMYPVCQAHFPLLCKNLYIHKSNKYRLAQMRAALVETSKTLLSETASLMPARTSALPPERERFLQNDILLWNCGTLILENGLKAVFEDDPDASSLPPRDLSELWSAYLGKDHKITDIADLMRHIVSQMPDEEFTSLYDAIKTAQDKQSTAMERFENFLIGACGGTFNWLTLKGWIDRTT